MKKDKLKNLLTETNYQRFHTLTKQLMHKKHLDPKHWPKEWKTIYYKEYPRFDKIVLPSPQKVKKSFSQIICERKSTRNFTGKSLSLEQISNLLFYSAGEKTDLKRFYPSAGARYPLELYLISLNSDLPNGIYHYHVKSHSLEILFDSKTATMLDNQFTQSASLVIFITGVFKRNTLKYGDRGYQYILIETGHIAQNIYLNATAQKIGVCALGGYNDDKINNILMIDGLEESLLHTMVLGSIS